MILIKDMSLNFGDRAIFNDVSITFKDKDRIGLIGKNGAGKTTLFKLINKQINPDSGVIEHSNIKNLGYLEQHLNVNSDQAVIDRALEAFAHMNGIKTEVVNIGEQINTRTDYESEEYMTLISKYSTLSEMLYLSHPEKQRGNAERVLKGLGFKDKDLEMKMSTFSGGWQMRVELARILLSEPDMLLLDEPTNYLDIESIVWLEQHLVQAASGVIIISHDRSFLDNITNKTVEVVQGRIYEYSGSYSKAMLEREEQLVIREAAIINQQKFIQDKQKLVDRFRAKASKSTMAKSLEKQLSKIEILDQLPSSGKKMNIRFLPSPRSGDVVIECTNLSKSFGTKEVFKNINLEVLRGEKVALVGQNGQGKSTLVKIISQLLTASGGECVHGYNIHFRLFQQDQAEQLDSKNTVLEALEAYSSVEMRPKLRAILGAFLFSGDDIDKKVAVLSGGEKNRLALSRLLLEPYNLLILDEPTNHLDMDSKDVLREALDKYDGTLLIISHDRYFLDGLTKRTLELRDGNLYNHLGDINYFLEKRATDTFRDIEKKTESNNSPEPNFAKETILSEDEKQEVKRLNRKLQNIEREIENMNKEYKSIELTMSESEFYDRSDSAAVIAKYQDIKAKLATKNQEWDVIAEELMALEN